MKRFAVILTIMAVGYIMGGILLKILPPDIEALNRFLISLHVYSNASTAVLGALGTGLLLSGTLLLAIAVGFFHFDRAASGPFVWSTRKFLIFVLGLNLILSSIYIIFTPYIPLGGDDLWYFAQAQRLSVGLDPSWNHAAASQVGGEPTAYWPIGYSVFLSVFFKLFGAHMWVGQFLNSLCLAGIVLLTYLLGRNLFDEHVAKRASLTVALIPSLLFISLALMSDIYFTVMQLYLLYLAQKKGYPVFRIILMGLVFGLALMTREIIFFVPLVVGIYWLLRDKHWKPVVLSLTVIYILGELILLPWQIRNYRDFGRFVPLATHGGYVFWMGNNPDTPCHGPQNSLPTGEIRDVLSNMNEVERDAMLMKMGLSNVISHPLWAVSRLPQKMFYMYFRDSQCLSWGIRGSAHLIPSGILSGMYLITDEYYYALGFAFIFSIIALLKKEKFSPRTWLIIGPIVVSTTINVLVLPECRYHLPLMPLFALVAVLPFPLFRPSNHIKNLPGQR